MTEGHYAGEAASSPVDVFADTYEARFDAEHRLRLLDRKDTFRVSAAGLELGKFLLGNVRPSETAGRILDVGTGSGVIALLLRALGATMIAATDISESSVNTARENELANFGDSIIDFSPGDLFPSLGPDGARQRFDLIVFNPPGWRAPSETLRAALDRKHGALDLNAMFYGDSVLLRFLEHLPDHLTENGRAIVSFNSLVGIEDIMSRSSAARGPLAGQSPQFRLLERLEIPLLFYTPEWTDLSGSLIAEFERGRQEYGATYVTRDETIHWFYEITEVTVGGCVEPAHQAQADQGHRGRADCDDRRGA